MSAMPPGEEPKIILTCQRCHQKLRVPVRMEKLRITCPACRHEFDYPEGDEFYLQMPREVKGLIVAGGLVVTGLLLYTISNALPALHLPWTVAPLTMAMMLFGGVLAMAFGLALLVEAKTFKRFYRVRKLVLTKQGIAQFNKDGSSLLLVAWRQVKAIEAHYVRSMFMGAIETSREPVGITLELLNGEKLNISLNLFFSVTERERLVALVGRYGAQA